MTRINIVVVADTKGNVTVPYAGTDLAKAQAAYNADRPEASICALYRNATPSSLRRDNQPEAVNRSSAAVVAVPTVAEVTAKLKAANEAKKAPKVKPAAKVVTPAPKAPVATAPVVGTADSEFLAG
jgi:hypothetical protein